MRDFGRTHDARLKQQAAELDRRAREHLLLMSRHSYKEEVALLAGVQFLEMGEAGLARDVLKAASDRAPGNRDLAANYLNAATRAGDTQGAAQARQRLAELEKTKNNTNKK
jgi:thioredoxin-like negative regulator of GroEL